MYVFIVLLKQKHLITQADQFLGLQLKKQSD